MLFCDSLIYFATASDLINSLDNQESNKVDLKH